MGGSKTHIYSALVIFAIVFLFLGYVTVSNRTAIAPVSQGDGWGSGAVVGAPPIPDVPLDRQRTDPKLQTETHPYISPFATNKPIANQNNTPTANNNSDWEQLQKQLGKSTKPGSATTQDPTIDAAYSFIPSGLFSPPISTEPESEEARALFEYGNGLGAAILTYESSHPDQAAVLTNFAQDRENIDKQNAMKQLGADLGIVAEALEALFPTPPELGTTVTALAQAYRDLGTKLALIPDAKSDDDLVKAILTYNASAESFVRTYVALALTLQAHGITFGQNDPGSVFMMPANSGL